MKLSNKEILFINALQDIVGVNARDCLIEEKRLSFIVNENDMGKAIGKNGERIKKLGEKANKQIELYAFTKKPEEFIKKAFAKIKFNEITITKNEKKIMQIVCDLENKMKLLRNPLKFKRVKKIMQRNFEIEDVKVK